MAKGDWSNEMYVREKDVPKPCLKLGYCPYGKLVDEFPLLLDRDVCSCPVFGNQCPVHYLAEELRPDMLLRVQGLCDDS